jgi:hypothetical protein
VVGREKRFTRGFITLPFSRLFGQGAQILDTCRPSDTIWVGFHSPFFETV